jgi:hypothetical protein
LIILSESRSQSSDFAVSVFAACKDERKEKKRKKGLKVQSSEIWAACKHEARQVGRASTGGKAGWESECRREELTS